MATFIVYWGTDYKNMLLEFKSGDFQHIKYAILVYWR